MKSPLAPFRWVEHATSVSVLLADTDMLARVHIFEERADEGWEGFGYDWASVARVILDEDLADIADRIGLDPEAGMFAAYGEADAVERLAQALHVAYHDEARLRDVLSRAELD
ncbi:MAG: immunity 51 family protein [Bacteroidetes bacterium]|nr:immunity 51 family protein [Bacteroidota bacterium]